MLLQNQSLTFALYFLSLVNLVDLYRLNLACDLQSSETLQGWRATGEFEGAPHSEGVPMSRLVNLYRLNLAWGLEDEESSEARWTFQGECGSLPDHIGQVQAVARVWVARPMASHHADAGDGAAPLPTSDAAHRAPPHDSRSTGPSQADSDAAPTNEVAADDASAKRWPRKARRPGPWGCQAAAAAAKAPTGEACADGAWEEFARSTPSPGRGWLTGTCERSTRKTRW
uniref:Uncharacterized protein LOC116941502 isoform X1 n=1 Tax=Petromyzon marinus TaxID=7757 RepID=A0AAJ7T1Q6_PETMA|nr:uncharacterized protein LOC116941502 isoform X1 [Petromyzon marinus]